MAEDKRRLAYVIHEEICTVYKHDDRDALCEKTAHAVYASDWFYTFVTDLKREALREAADKWQLGEWANAPRRTARIEERMANAQFVSDWLREQASSD